ncbi:MAG: hypothetical protein HY587_05360 [Candidatus Omnitrophica bacterium]|nr:hypothetical protein [Candidatus Omnitrophota bacterium]
MRATSLIVLLIFGAFLMLPPAGFAGHGLGEATASLLLPTTGQAMNGQISSAKTKIMGGLEAGLITTTAILGGVVGGPVVWAGVGPLIANHVWSALDAYSNSSPEVSDQQKQLEEAQRILQESQRRNRARQGSSFLDNASY